MSDAFCSQFKAAIEFQWSLVSFPACELGREIWEPLGTHMLAKMAEKMLARGALQAWLSRGFSVDEGNLFPAIDWRGGGIYEFRLLIGQWLIGYTGKSDQDVRVRQQRWQRDWEKEPHELHAFFKARDAFPSIPQTTPFLIFAILKYEDLINLLQELGCSSTIMDHLRSYPFMQIINTIASLLEATTIARFANFNNSDWRKLWEQWFGEAFPQVLGCNGTCAAQGNWLSFANRRLGGRGTVVEGVVTFLGSDGAIAHTVSGSTGLDDNDFFGMGMIAAACSQLNDGISLVLSGPVGHRRKNQWTLRIIGLPPLCIPVAISQALELEEGVEYTYEMRFGWIEGWSAFAAVDDATFPAIAGAVVEFRLKDRYDADAPWSQWTTYFSTNSGGEAGLSLHKQVASLLAPANAQQPLSSTMATSAISTATHLPGATSSPFATVYEDSLANIQRGSWSASIHLGTGRGPSFYLPTSTMRDGTMLRARERAVINPEYVPDDYRNNKQRVWLKIEFAEDETIVIAAVWPDGHGFPSPDAWRHDLIPAQPVMDSLINDIALLRGEQPRRPPPSAQLRRGSARLEGILVGLITGTWRTTGETFQINGTQVAGFIGVSDPHIWFFDAGREELYARLTTADEWSHLDRPISRQAIILALEAAEAENGPLWRAIMEAFRVEYSDEEEGEEMDAEDDAEGEEMAVQWEGM